MRALSGGFVRARIVPRTAVVGTAAAAAVLLLAVPALAHITITPDSVPAGTAAVLTFHVPNEEAHANTTQVDVQIPTTHPIAQLLVKPVPGWKITVKTVALPKPVVTDDGSFTSAVSEVIWSGGQIVPGQFQDFTVSADPLPQGVSQVVFKAIQTYSNGDIVRWIDLAQAGQPEPEHPAPVLALTTGAATASGTSTGTGTGTGTGAGTAKTSTATAAASVTDGTARALAIAGLLVGLLAGLLALVVAGRSRRSLARAGGPGDGASLNGGASSHSEAEAPASGDRVTAAGKRAPDPGRGATKVAAPRNPPRRRR
jgi:periplasmic copper chaperone A